MRTANYLLLRICMLTIMLSIYGLCEAQDINKTFSGLDAIVGKWQMETSKGSIYETWRKINDTLFSSKSYKINGRDTILLEDVDLVKRGENILYVPTAHGQNNEMPVTFTLISSDNDTYTFENKAHDFPQRIIYMLPKNNAMHARIEGTVNGNFKKSDYYFKKVF